MSARSVARSVAEERRPTPAEPGAARQYVNQWVEAEALDGEEVRAFVLILKTRGCYWADVKGCSMCGYARDTLGRSATPEELGHQLEDALGRYRDEPYVKVYTSGSFLDDREVDAASRQRMLRAFAGKARRFLFETLPEFATPGTLAPLAEAFPGEIEVALGLESANPEVLARLINKGSTPEEYFAAGDRVRAAGMKSKAYLLLKPPYLGEGEAIADVVESVGLTQAHFDAMSINPVHIQNGTVVEWLYHRRRYRPPWLWSVVEALIDGSARRGRARLVSFPTAGGLARGPHNCGRCDRRVLAAIQRASLTQAFDALRELDCSCRANWEAVRSLEPMGVEA